MSILYVPLYTSVSIRSLSLLGGPRRRTRVVQLVCFQRHPWGRAGTARSERGGLEERGGCQWRNWGSALAWCLRVSRSLSQASVQGERRSDFLQRWELSVEASTSLSWGLYASACQVGSCWGLDAGFLRRKEGRRYMLGEGSIRRGQVHPHQVAEI